MSTNEPTATTATLDTTGNFSKFNGRTFEIARHLPHGVILLLPNQGGEEVVETEFLLSEVILNGNRPASLVVSLPAKRTPEERRALRAASRRPRTGGAIGPEKPQE